MIRLAVLAAAALALAGCAQLTVTVDVANPTVARAAAVEAGLRLDALNVVQGGHAQANAAVGRIYDIYKDFHDRCLDEAIAMTKEAAPKAAAAAAAASQDKTLQLNSAILQNNLTSLPISRGPVGQTGIRQARAASLDVLIKADDAAFAALRDAGLPATVLETIDTPLPEPVRTALLLRRGAFADEAAKVRGYINDPFRGAQCVQTAAAAAEFVFDGPRKADAVAAGADAAKQRVDVAAQHSIIGSGILLDQMIEAYFVASAPKDAWAKRYNKAFGQGLGGSTSIALKMNDTADFSVKGFVFDGRATAELVKKVGTQALTIIAGAAGAPVSIGAPTGNATAPTATFAGDKTVSAADTAIMDAEAHQAAYNQTLFRLADSISANWDLLMNDDVQAKKAVGAGFDAYKDSWKAPDK